MQVGASCSCHSMLLGHLCLAAHAGVHNVDAPYNACCIKLQLQQPHHKRRQCSDKGATESACCAAPCLQRAAGPSRDCQGPRCAGDWLRLWPVWHHCSQAGQQPREWCTCSQLPVMAGHHVRHMPATPCSCLMPDSACASPPSTCEEMWHLVHDSTSIAASLQAPRPAACHTCSCN